jgi:hypothetical protein
MTLIIITGSITQLENDARDYWTIEAMAKYGGSFVKALAEAARRADPQNLARVKTAWPEYWAEYEKTGRELEAKHDRGEK